MFTLKFWRAAGERSIKTIAQAAAALLSGNGLGITDVAWLDLLNVSLLAGVASLLTSVGSAALTGEGPSLTGDEHLDEVGS